jgi:prevent-host-death family protein
MPNTQANWDLETAIRDGVITVRDLSHHTSEVLRHVVERAQPLAITKSGRIVAALTPMTMRHVVDLLIANDDEFRGSMTAANEALRDGKTMPADKALE